MNIEIGRVDKVTMNDVMFGFHQRIGLDLSAEKPLIYAERVFGFGVDPDEACGRYLIISHTSRGINRKDLVEFARENSDLIGALHQSAEESDEVAPVFGRRLFTYDTALSSKLLQSWVEFTTVDTYY